MEESKKDQLIQEMIKSECGYYIAAQDMCVLDRNSCNCACTDYRKAKHFLDNFISIGDYRKITENEVVISKKEYESIKKENEKLKNYNNKLSQGIYYGNGEQFCHRLDQARTETAEKIIKLVYSTLTDEEVWNKWRKWWLCNGGCKELKNLLYELAKQAEVKIDIDNKEEV